MTTPHDLLITVLDTSDLHRVFPGDLSLALAGAELIDLLAHPTIRLDGGRIVPGHLPHAYDAWWKANAPTVTVTVTGDGHSKRSKEVSVKRGSPTKADFALPIS